MSICERKKEIKRRRHRKVKLKVLRARFAAAADTREKVRILEKLHKISPSVARELQAQASA